ncbi:protein TolR [Roseomonas sp. CAU 1739]|uniref:protein TolR n=1 Tax=Roseomonas sp. CAU 1739 TaxID=3140364 RepID=UPI00325BCF53
MASPLIGARTNGRGRYRPMAEINVTPMVDVMLVLLIIFMVAAPLMTVGVPVDLPRTAATPLNQETEPLTISVDPQGRVFLQETEVPMDNLVPQLRAIMQNQPQGAPERRIFVRGDRAIAYGKVMEVMGTIAAAGFTRVALLAEQPGGAARPAGAPAPAAPARPAGRPGAQSRN